MLKTHNPIKQQQIEINMMTKLNKLVLIILCISSVNAFSQNIKNYVDGELLIRLNEGVNTIDLNQYSNIELKQQSLISKHMNIWKFNFNEGLIEINDAINLLYTNKNVHTVQKNHIIKHRATPDDTDFGNQWQYSQTNNKDIDADLAWDITTGGLTSSGDTIVACVIDDGAKFDHPDLAPNLWVNYNEIPNNNIDDDGNGYIDDVRGWNAYDSNDNPAHSNFWEGHGSAVAGIVGAKGNNGEGVAGVNWNVKLMIIKGGGQESDAISAYSYALENRKLYNSTNGEKGAFVVCTNASWGVDGGQASSAPLWCAMYDTLGNHGILSTGATANANTNVDVDGDLPTQCPSDFLITVTNTNQQDTKVTSAGYGTTTIDLGAPGANAYTVSDDQSNGYSGFGGTSGATPHVTGTIALLYSVHCSTFSDLYKTNPKLAAEKVRDFILEGVDANTSLDGITTTGGRLNVNNSVLLMYNEYSCITVGNEEKSLSSNSINLYPNPIADESVNINYNSDSNEASGYLTISDMTGKVIFTKNLNLITGNNVINIDLSDISNGMYNMTIVSGSNSETVRFVK